MHGGVMNRWGNSQTTLSKNRYNFTWWVWPITAITAIAVIAVITAITAAITAITAIAVIAVITAITAAITAISAIAVPLVKRTLNLRLNVGSSECYWSVLFHSTDITRYHKISPVSPWSYLRHNYKHGEQELRASCCSNTILDWLPSDGNQADIVIMTSSLSCLDYSCTSHVTYNTLSRNL